jgi:4-hydroxybenzoate polyprenyltransferase
MPTLRNYLSLVKFSHTIFALPFAILGFLFGCLDNLAGLQWLLFIKIIGCMIFARTAAMSFNRWADQYFDAQNSRTAIREIPSGVIKPTSAMLLVVTSSLLFCILTYSIILGYSYTKRFTYLCHFILGIGLSLAPIGAYMAVANTCSPFIVLLGFVVLTWVSGFDIIYALQDEVFDKSNQLHSIPVKIGRANALLLSRLIHLITSLLLIIIAWQFKLDSWFVFASIFFIGALIYQQSIVKVDDLSKVNLAFGTTNGVASLVFALLTAIGLISKLAMI